MTRKPVYLFKAGIPFYELFNKNEIPFYVEFHSWDLDKDKIRSIKVMFLFLLMLSHLSHFVLIPPATMDYIILIVRSHV
jgi:hypothetical protein